MHVPLRMEQMQLALVFDLVGREHAVLLRDHRVAAYYESVGLVVVDEIAAGDIDRSLVIALDESAEAILLRARSSDEPERERRAEDENSCRFTPRLQKIAPADPDAPETTDKPPPPGTLNRLPTLRHPRRTVPSLR